MNKTGFYGRDSELELLERLWNSSKASLLVLYGRRRVGKTRLLTRWIGQNPGRAVYWVAEPTLMLDQLRSFSQALYNFVNPGSRTPSIFVYDNWEQAFEHVALLAQKERLALFIDEVTYLMDADPYFAGTLQKMWDHKLSHTNLFLSLCGSQMGLMQRQILSYQAPLYGRASAELKLLPLPYGVVKQFFPNYTAAERVTIYAIFGGIPAYWERLNPAVPIMQNVLEQLLTSNTLMQEEPRLLLQDFITDPHGYVGIMRAISQGAHTQGEISKVTHLTQGHISKYLSVLRDTGFVERRVSVTEQSDDSRRGRYFVTDPYLRFYYRFLFPHLAKLVLGEQKLALQAIEQDLSRFIESNTWRELCGEWLLRAGSIGAIPAAVERVGEPWTRAHTFDIVGINQAERTLVLGICQWGESPCELDTLNNLVTKTQAVIPKSGSWSVYYVGFSSSGWTPLALEQANHINHFKTLSGRGWQCIGMQLLDLERLDADLSQ